MSREYATKACQRTGARVNMDGEEFDHHIAHPNQVPKIHLGDLIPYLDDYAMNRHDPSMEDFIWSIDDNQHTDSISKELTETDIPWLLLFAERAVIQAARASSSSGPAEVAGKACKDELSSLEVLAITVLNLGNLARQTIQHQAEPRMLRLIMNQTSHIMMLVEGTSLTVNQWDEEAACNWRLESLQFRWWSPLDWYQESRIRHYYQEVGWQLWKRASEDMVHKIFEIDFGFSHPQDVQCGRADRSSIASW